MCHNPGPVWRPHIVYVVITFNITFDTDIAETMQMRYFWS